MSFASSEVGGQYAGTAIWALGQLRDYKLKGFFMETLEASLAANDHNMLYQTISALDRLDEDSGPSKTSLSSLEVAENRKLARELLMAHERSS